MRGNVVVAIPTMLCKNNEKNNKPESSISYVYGNG